MYGNSSQDDVSLLWASQTQLTPAVQDQLTDNTGIQSCMYLQMLKQVPGPCEMVYFGSGVVNLTAESIIIPDAQHYKLSTMFHPLTKQVPLMLNKIVFKTKIRRP